MRHSNKADTTNGVRPLGGIPRLQWPLSWKVHIHQATPLICEDP